MRQNTRAAFGGSSSVQALSAIPAATPPRIDPEHLVRHDARLNAALEDGDSGHRRIKEPVRLHGAIVVGFIIETLHRIRHRKPGGRLLNIGYCPSIASSLRLYFLFDLSDLDVRQLPRLVEQRLLRTVEAGEHLETTLGVGRDPVRFLALPEPSGRRRCPPNRPRSSSAPGSARSGRPTGHSG